MSYLKREVAEFMGYEGSMTTHQLTLEGRSRLVVTGVEHVERVGVPQSTHKLSLTLYHSLAVEAVGQPRGRVDVEIPADSVCTVLCKCIKRVNCVAL